MVGLKIWRKPKRSGAGLKGLGVSLLTLALTLNVGCQLDQLWTVPDDRPLLSEAADPQPTAQQPTVTNPPVATDSQPTASAVKPLVSRPNLTASPVQDTEDPSIGLGEYEVPGVSDLEPESRLTPDPNTHYVALTFDDGPNGDYTAYLLDELKKRSVQAAFFVVGERLQYPGNQAVAKRAVAEGHLLANHTYNHLDLSVLKPEEVYAEVNDTDEAILDLTGRRAAFLRPPYGSYSKTVQQQVHKPFILWSVDPQDWQGDQDAATLVDSIVNQLEANRGHHRGDIVLLHDIHPRSIDAAVILLDLLPSKGYTFVRVDQLLEMAGQPWKPGQPYYALP